MTTRGKVLREPSADPGLLMIEGQQYRFSLDGIWKSEITPKPGLVVDVERNQNSQITAITVIPESQLNKERAEAAMSKAKEKGGQIFAQLAAKCGTENLVAGVLLIFGWFVLTTLSIQIPVLGNLKFTFWQVLGLLNAGNLMEAMDRGIHSSAGIYGLLALVALAGPFVHLIWKDRRAVLGGLAPLLFMLIIWIMARHSILSAFGGNLAGADNEVIRQAQAEAMKGVSLGFGAYLSVLASIYFAVAAVKRFLQGRAADTALPVRSNRAVA